MRIRIPSFGKRAANGTAPPPVDPQAAPDPDPPFTLHDLQQELAGIRQDVKELAAERETLSLSALQGDVTAQARIQEIDEARAEFLKLDETFSSAIRELAKHERASGWRHLLPRMQRQLRVELRLHWVNVAPRLQQAMLGRQSNDYAALRDALQELEALEQRLAREVAHEVLPAQRPQGYIAGDASDYSRYQREREALDQQRAKVVAEATKELLASTALQRPEALDQAIEAAKERLANQPRTEQGMR